MTLRSVIATVTRTYQHLQGARGQLFARPALPRSGCLANSPNILLAAHSPYWHRISSNVLRQLVGIPMTQNANSDECQYLHILGVSSLISMMLGTALVPSKSVECDATLRCRPKFKVPPRRCVHGSRIRTLYHITGAGPAIAESGEMLRGSGGSVGGGIYFASTVQECMGKALSGGYLVKAEVFTGREKHVDISMTALLPALGPMAFLALLHPLLPFALQSTLAAVVLAAMVDLTGVAVLSGLAILAGWLAVTSAANKAKFRNAAINAVLGVETHAAESETFRKLWDEGYDSVVVLGFRSGVEYVVYNCDQVHIVYVKDMDAGWLLE